MPPGAYAGPADDRAGQWQADQGDLFHALAQAFESIRYPTLPEIEAVQAYAGGREQRQETLHIRNYSLYTPRDFDVSPFFDIIKPRVRAGFDHRSLRWSKDAGP